MPPPYANGREAAAKTLNDLASDEMALDRLFRLRRKMQRDPERRRIMFETVAKFEEKGRVVRIDPKDYAATPPGRPR